MRRKTAGTYQPTEQTCKAELAQLRHVVEKLVATTMDGDTITAEAVRQAIPTGTLSGADAQVPMLIYENDSLDDFLDRTLLGLYEQLLASTGSHSQVARLLRIDRTSLYQRIERARRRTSLASP